MLVNSHLRVIVRIVEHSHIRSWLKPREIDLVDHHFCLSRKVLILSRMDLQREKDLGLIIVERTRWFDVYDFSRGCDTCLF